jgi:ATP-dependent DNA ligase
MAEPFSRLVLPPSTPPMEARLSDEIPAGEDWQFEPKWDGFRCLAFRDGKDIELMSKSGKPLARYFPEVVAALLAVAEDRCILDGELILPLGEVLSFDALQLRLHPAASRIDKLSRQTPAQLMLFDALQLGPRDLAAEPLQVRRDALETFAARVANETLLLSPIALERSLAEQWFAQTGGALDGIVAKRRDEPYQPGERAMTKVKKQRTADCVVGGYRTGSGGKVASLLLGLYDKAGLLHSVGFVSAFSDNERAELMAKLAPHHGPSAFTGSSPGGPSRWSKGRSTEWVPLKPELVAEVVYDQVTGQRFRHGTTLLRWRPDKAARQCTMEQLEHELRPAALRAALEAAD